MITTMAIVTMLIFIQAMLADLSTMSLVVGGVFYIQLISVVIPLFPAIRGVDNVLSDGSIGAVRRGLGTLARVHHQGLVMASTTLIAEWVFITLR